MASSANTPIVSNATPQTMAAAGVPFPGHTEMLQALATVPGQAPPPVPMGTRLMLSTPPPTASGDWPGKTLAEFAEEMIPTTDDDHH